jgi:uncharacterized transporter YbjL
MKNFKDKLKKSKHKHDYQSLLNLILAGSAVTLFYNKILNNWYNLIHGRFAGALPRNRQD